ncbi:hypothetical protein B0T18DRAFT_314436 [Schizothecium vesticola]|uniref:FAD/NAD(P)-binding domain-containing protein n=1 Tax=Schizothecium vesticola TaxID=314040 RepID=A0AA40FAS2_9PEZI|nr:hypothetical protein B0T18DRAFT_314436 [Schizothecium vesticola]
MAEPQHSPPRKRVLIVGAGAAGMSCAHHLAEHPDKFDVTLVEAADYCGGQAFSIPLDKAWHGASWLNQGVQGGSNIFHHTMTMFARQGFVANPVKLQVSFGKGDQFWTNVFPTKLLERHRGEIRRFVWMLKIVRWFEVLFALVPIKVLMKLFWFSDEFTNAVALPMVALFLGTGNYTPGVPSIMLERLCTSPTYGMWYPPDKERIASNLPPMVVFPNLSRFYETWRQDLVKKGVNIRLSTEVTQVVSRNKNGVTVKTIQRTPAPDGHNPSRSQTPQDETTEHYDELVLCCLADTSHRLLLTTSSLLERLILSRAKFSNDLTITHTDASYMRRHYETAPPPSQTTTPTPTPFHPMYFTRQYPSSPSKLDLSFDCTAYQAQFPPPSTLPLDRHVFQTIFLHRERDGHLWTDDEIDPAKILRRDAWHQLCHAWTHYALVVPWLWLLQGRGRRRTRFAGSWTVVNAHETAVLSGVAAAVDLGAGYPEDLERDGGGFALMCFRMYYLLVYGRWYRRRVLGAEEGATGLGKGLNGSVYCGPGVGEVERGMWMEERERDGGDGEGIKGVNL